MCTVDARQIFERLRFVSVVQIVDRVELSRPGVTQRRRQPRRQSLIGRHFERLVSGPSLVVERPGNSLELRIWPQELAAGDRRCVQSSAGHKAREWIGNRRRQIRWIGNAFETVGH